MYFADRAHDGFDGRLRRRPRPVETAQTASPISFWRRRGLRQMRVRAHQVRGSGLFWCNHHAPSCGAVRVTVSDTGCESHCALPGVFCELSLGQRERLCIVVGFVMFTPSRYAGPLSGVVTLCSPISRRRGPEPILRGQCGKATTARGTADNFQESPQEGLWPCHSAKTAQDSK